MKYLRENKGVTLVVLLIIFVIILILVGVEVFWIVGLKNKNDKTKLESTQNENIEQSIYDNNSTTNGVWHYSEDKKITNGTTTIEIGDKINYDATKDENGNTLILSYTSPKSKNGYANQTFDVNGAQGKEWRVLGIDENGQILIMPTTNIITDSNSYGNYYLGSDSDYSLAQLAQVNAESELDNISAIYGYGKGASGGRSIKVEDVNRITGYNPNNVGEYDPNQTGSGTKYGAGEIWEYGNKITYLWTETKNKVLIEANNQTHNIINSDFAKYGFNWYDTITKSWKKSVQDVENPIEITTLTSTDYYYYPGTLQDEDIDIYQQVEKTIISGSKEYNMLFGNDTNNQTYYLGSSCNRIGEEGSLYRNKKGFEKQCWTVIICATLVVSIPSFHMVSVLQFL